MKIGTTLLLGLVALAVAAKAEQRRQDFASDPGWEGKNNRGEKTPCRTTAQDFGFSADSVNAGGERGEIGGYIQMAAAPAYYALRLPKPLTLKDRLSASGTVAFPEPAAAGPFLVGFFNAEKSIGWRTRDSLMVRLDHRGPVFHAHIEYATDRWRAGAGAITVVDPATGKRDMKEFPLAGVHHWAFEYDPDGNKGGGSAVFTMDGEQAAMNLDPGHKTDGAVFDRFGLLNVMKSSDNRVKCYLDDLTINGQNEDFGKDPGWEAVGNHRSYEDCIVRPRCDFGFSLTNFAGGAKGELGGIVFRGDDRQPHKLAYYGDRVEPMNLKAPLLASGRVCLTRGISDSTALIGWFHSELSHRPGNGDGGLPNDFLGVMVEGPSSEGFFFRPAMRSENEYAYERGPVILPDGKPRKWELRFTPRSDGREGTMTVSLDDQSAHLELKPEQQLPTAHFNRFGIVTTRVDGNYQFIYFDDLEYTCKQDGPSTQASP